MGIKNRDKILFLNSDCVFLEVFRRNGKLISIRKLSQIDEWGGEGAENAGRENAGMKMQDRNM